MQLQLIRDAVPHAVIIAGMPAILGRWNGVGRYLAYDIDRFRFILDIGSQRARSQPK